MDLIPVDENESSLFDMINLILDEVVAFTVYEIVDFIFFMDMFVRHVKIIIPDNAVDRQTDVGFFVNNITHRRPPYHPKTDPACAGNKENTRRRFVLRKNQKDNIVGKMIKKSEIL